MSVLSDRALALLEHLHIDPESDRLLDALTEGMLAPADRLSTVAHGETVGLYPAAAVYPSRTLYPGGTELTSWQALTDPAVAPLWALPYAAQWTGGIMPPRRAGESDDDYQARASAEVVHPRGMLRGGATSLKIIANAFLTGDQEARVVERPGDDLWSAIVLVNSTAIGDRVDALAAALNDPEVLPAGFEILVEASDAPLIDEGTQTIDAVAVTIDDATITDVT